MPHGRLALLTLVLLCSNCFEDAAAKPFEADAAEELKASNAVENKMEKEYLKDVIETIQVAEAAEKREAPKHLPPDVEASAARATPQ